MAHTDSIRYSIWVAASLFADDLTRDEATVSFRWAALEGVPSMTITKGD